MSTGRIESWDRAKGFGFVECDGRRVFLHHRDFAERHKAPEVGDVVTFTLGTDKKGRPCATQAVHRNDGGRIRPAHLIVVLILLIAPLLAARRWDPEHGLWLLAICYVSGSAITYFLYADDKQRAKERAWRSPERGLHFFALAGGWPGAFLAQRRLRHKSAKLRFQFVFWLIVGAHQFVAVDYLLDWKWSRTAFEAIRESVFSKTP
ncbi:MAG: DUF1294 domain-containing protein [Opitutaceae bacterium]